MVDIALVSYINTRPFMDGIEQVLSKDEVRLHLMPPSECARALKEERVDMALMPIGALINFDQINLLPDYCIGGDGSVNSVFIFSQVPIEEVSYLYLDPHSRSSNGLARILLRHYWKKELPFDMFDQRPFDLIQGRKAGVIIGDQAIRTRNSYPYAYDLSEYWKKLTGLSFPFAVWGYRPEKFSPDLLEKIQKAMRLGVEQRKMSALKWANYYDIPPEFAVSYLEQDIDYIFDSDKHLSLKLYQDALKALPALDLQAV